MMLHERPLSNIVIKKINTYLQNYIKILGNDTLHFNNKIGEYVGIKNHYGYPFLIKENGSIVYPRGSGGKVIMCTFLSLKNKDFHSRNKLDGYTYRVKLKK